MNETTASRELAEGDTWAQVIARTLKNAGSQLRKFDWANDPAGKGANRATFDLCFEGIMYRVTVQETGPEPE